MVINMNKMIFRRATHADITSIVSLLEQVLYIHHVGRPDIFKEKGQKYTTQRLAEIIEDDKNPVFVCEDKEGKILGHCFCQSIIQEETPAMYSFKTLYIDDLCVDENARGNKVGKFLYDNVKSYARENGYFNITLHAWEKNPQAVEFYSHMGMQIQQYTMEEVLI